jgi:hypothetical protein
MKNIIRQMIGFSFGIPYVFMIWYLSIFIEREKALQIIGHHITRLAKGSLRYWVPYIRDASEFDLLRSKMKGNLRFWSPLFDVSIVKDNQNTFKVHVQNCPFCEAFIKLGMPELAPYVCEGDWEKAKSNKNKWLFERKHQIGTGDSFCDHTYKRIVRP